MYYPETLQKAMISGDIIAIRAALIALVDKDKNNMNPQATEIADAVSNELQTKNISLFDKDNGHFKLPPEQEWTVDTWHGIKAAMMINFSREKFIMADQTRARVFHGSHTIDAVSRENIPKASVEANKDVFTTEKFTSRYEITVPLKNAISKMDLIAIRSALIAMVDKDYSRITPIAHAVALEVDDFLKKKNVSLFVADNGRLILPPPNEWTIDTLHGVKAAMLINFSIEKFILVDKILASIKHPSDKGWKEPQLPPVGEPKGPQLPPVGEPKGPQLPPPGGGRKRVTGNSHDQQSSMLITGGVLIIGGIVVGAIVAGTIGAIVGGGAGIAFSAKIINKRK